MEEGEEYKEREFHEEENMMWKRDRNRKKKVENMGRATMKQKLTRKNSLLPS